MPHTQCIELISFKENIVFMDHYSIIENITTDLHAINVKRQKWMTLK